MSGLSLLCPNHQATICLTQLTWHLAVLCLCRWLNQLYHVFTLFSFFLREPPASCCNARSKPDSGLQVPAITSSGCTTSATCSKVLHVVYWFAYSSYLNLCSHFVTLRITASQCFLETKKESRAIINITYSDVPFSLPVFGCLFCHLMIKIGAFSSLLVVQVQAGSKLEATWGVLAAHGLLLPRSVNYRKNILVRSWHKCAVMLQNAQPFMLHTSPSALCFHTH